MIAISERLILLSGGIDSFVCGHLLSNKNRKASSLFINYGQAAYRSELYAANAVAKNLGIPLFQATANLSNSFKDGEVTGRNMLLASIALTASLIHNGAIVLGIHAGTAYFDCSPRFFALMDGFIQETTDGLIRLEAPLLHWDKAKILRYASTKKLPLELTYSCENGTEPACGKCLSCKDRRALC